MVASKRPSSAEAALWPETLLGAKSPARVWPKGRTAVAVSLVNR